jgi:Flp pilus assembly pilin Flp
MLAFRNDRGAATAEFAMIMPALVLLIALIAGAGTIGLSQLRAHDAARAAAREAARGEPENDIRREARERAGSGAVVDIRHEGGYTAVEVSVPLPESLHPIRESVAATATARTEGIR